MKSGNPSEMPMAVRARRTRLTLSVLTVLVFLLGAAGSPPADPDELVRRANERLRANDADAVDAADKLYAEAEERATDPGLVAFDRAGVLFERKRYRDAERHYDRVLGDAACPPDRAARAWYNRGTCLLNRGGTIEVYRAAIACFENALDNPAADPDVKDRAPHNLELAKLLWLEEAKKAKPDQPPSPNTRVPEELENKSPRSDPEQNGGPDQTAGPDPADAGATPRPGTQPQPATQPNGTDPKPSDQNTAGKNAVLQVIEDIDQVQQLNEEDARAYLKETAERRKRERRSLLDTLYGPERPGFRDW